jgi:NAD(P)-dependent dehydrogenase (short-subunit alcohol dehydrogenase family)
MKERWFAPHAPYSIAKFGMSLLALGLAGELRGKRIAVNALWPRTHHCHRPAIRNLPRRGSGDRRSAPARNRCRRGLSGISEAVAQLLGKFPHRRRLPRRRGDH